MFIKQTDESGSVVQYISSSQSYMAGDSVYIGIFMGKNYLQMQIVEESLEMLQI